MRIHFNNGGVSVPPSTPTSRQKLNQPEFDVTTFTVLYDHREREGGWRFQGLTAGSDRQYRPLLVKVREIHMVTADYTVTDDEGNRVPVFIERKSHADLIGSCGGGHERLRNEFERMKAINDEGGHCCMVVESSLDRIVDELSDPASSRQLDPAAIMGVVASWPQRFGVPIHFAGTRRLAEELAFRIMSKFFEHWVRRERNKAIASLVANPGSSAPQFANLF